MSSTNSNDNATSVIVVLGAPTTATGEPGPDMKQRLNRCLELLSLPQHAASIIAVTGGNPLSYGSSGVCTEAACMRDYLVSQGGSVSEDRILVEDRAIHTFHNALYVKTLLKKQGILKEDSPINLTILTTDWHMERSLLCFKAVYCDTPNVTLVADAVSSDPSDPQVVERKEKEKKLIKRWIPMCLKEEKDHPDMPNVDIAAQSIDLFRLIM